MTNANDRGAELYRAYLDGDSEAFETLVGLYRENVIFFCLRYLSVFEDAEDAAAEAFAALIINPTRYDFKTAFKTYLFSIAKKKAVDIYRKRARLASVDAVTDSEWAETIEASVLAEEEKRELHRALASLPADYGTVLHLVYFEELSCAEAASVMGKTKKQTENLLYRAKKTLRTRLEDGSAPKGNRYEIK